MNKFMVSCNLYRNWQSILTLFAVLSFTWTVIISHYCQCHCSLTIVFSVFNVHPLKISSTLETKKTRSDPAKFTYMTWRGTKTRFTFYRLISLLFVNLSPSDEGHQRAVAPNGNTNLRLFCIPTKWFFCFLQENMSFHIEFVSLRKGGHTSNSQQIWILPSEWYTQYIFWFFLHFLSNYVLKTTLGN